MEIETNFWDDSLLHSYRVLDLTDAMGMHCGEIMGGFGADVIKIEPPGGAVGSRTPPFLHDWSDPNFSLQHFAYNRNKRGITLNLESSEGQEIFSTLVKTAHFVVESFHPGYMNRLGIGYDDLSRIVPSLIVCSITPFGQTGPYRDYKSCDLVAEATGGLLYICGDTDRPPVRANMNMAYCQVGAQAALAMMTAHHWRRVTGEGQHIDVSMQESITAILWHTQAYWDVKNEVVQRLGSYLKREPRDLRLTYPCKDGAISWQISTRHQGSWTRHLVEWMIEEGMASQELQSVKWEDFDYEERTSEELDRWDEEFFRFFLTKTKSELVEQSFTRSIWMINPSNTIKDCIDDEQLNARNFWVEFDHPEFGEKIKYPGAPVLLSEVPWRMYRRAPNIGEHNRDIFVGELNIPENDLVRLEKGGII